MSNLSNILSFFSEFNCENKSFYIHDGSTNSSVDGTGINPSVNQANSSILYQYIKEKSFVLNPIVLDFGCGIGYLEKNDLVFGLEGSSNLIGHVVCDKKKVCITDFSKSNLDERLNKAFDISCSFEVVEHIPRKNQIQFWKNVAFCSDYHICGIHIKNQEDDKHCTIVSKEKWKSFFDKIGVAVIDLQSEFPWKKWKCSAFFLLDFRNSFFTSEDQALKSLYA